MSLKLYGWMFSAFRHSCKFWGDAAQMQLSLTHERAQATRATYIG